MTSQHEEIYKGYKIEIIQDEDALNPRDDDNLGTWYASHKRYTLGDKTPYDGCDFDSWDDLSSQIHADGAVICLPVYMHDHSGLSFSVTPFECRWDSGQIGFIYCSEDKISHWFGNPITPAILQRATEALVAEIEVYNQYSQGDVWGYKISKQESFIKKYSDGKEVKGIEWEEVENCWGYYGYNFCLEEAKGVIDGFSGENHD